jgi:hypothetical protein
MLGRAAWPGWRRQEGVGRDAAFHAESRSSQGEVHYALLLHRPVGRDLTVNEGPLRPNRVSGLNILRAKVARSANMPQTGVSHVPCVLDRSKSVCSRAGSVNSRREAQFESSATLKNID